MNLASVAHSATSKVRLLVFLGALPFEGACANRADSLGHHGHDEVATVFDRADSGMSNPRARAPNEADSGSLGKKADSSGLDASPVLPRDVSAVPHTYPTAHVPPRDGGSATDEAERVRDARALQTAEGEAPVVDASGSHDAFDAGAATTTPTDRDASIEAPDSGPPSVQTPGNCGASVSGPAHWDLMTSMDQARAQHVAVPLEGGKLLTIGGLGDTGGSGELDSAQLFDPCADEWSFAATPKIVRSGQTATLLADGRVLLVGSTGGDTPVAIAELYDATTDSWSAAATPPTAGPMLPLDDERVLIIAAAPAMHGASFDLTTGKWSSTAAASEARWGFEATRLDGDRVLVSGGFLSNPYRPALGAELYDAASGTWSPAGTLSRLRNGHAPVRLPSGRVLISGGYPEAPSPTPTATTEVYDPDTNEWSAGQDLLTARWIHSSTLLPDGRVLLAGGSASSGEGSALQSAELYDEVTDQFTTTAPLNVARWSHTATLLPDGRVLVTGGFDGTSFLSSVEIYTPEVP